MGAGGELYVQTLRVSYLPNILLSEEKVKCEGATFIVIIPFFNSFLPLVLRENSFLTSPFRREDTVFLLGTQILLSV